MDHSSSMLAWAAILFSLVGVFISILVTAALFQLGYIRKRVDELTIKLDGKMDSDDHDKGCSKNLEQLNQRFSEAWQRFDHRINKNESCIANHRHNEDGSVSVKV